MLILDENVGESQRRLFLRHRLHVRQIGVELGHKGMGDDDVLRLLHTLRRPTLITRDLRLFRAELCHPGYCLAILDVAKHELFGITLRLLEHREFDTAAKRMGKIIRAGEDVLRVWSFKEDEQRSPRW